MNTKKSLLAIILCVACSVPAADAFAREGHRGHDRGFSPTHSRYHYRDGRFYRTNLFGIEIVLGSAPIGAVVTTLPHGHKRVIRDHTTYYYYDNVYYRTCDSGYVVVPEPIIVYENTQGGNYPTGAVVKVLPHGFKTMIIGDITYHYYNNIYYKPCPGGYRIVESPLIKPSSTVTCFETAPEKIILINIPNSNGSYTPVKLTKQGNGYVGPQGEYYPNSPTVDQLSVLYSK